MRDLLYKDLRLAIHPLYIVLPLFTGALMLIPGWLYFIVLLYFCFISVPNILAAFKSQNDLMFSVMMPVRKKDIVSSRILAFMTYELIHVVIAIGFALINFRLYSDWPTLFLRPNVAFFGLVFIMYGLTNLTLFPLFFKTGYSYGVAAIVANAIAIGFAATVEVSVLKFESLYVFMHALKPSLIVYHWIILLGGLAFFLLSGWLAYTLSIKSFEKVDL